MKDKAIQLSILVLVESLVVGFLLGKLSQPHPLFISLFIPAQSAICYAYGLSALYFWNKERKV